MYGSIALVIALIGGGWYILNDWHYAPLKAQKKTISQQIISLQAQGRTIKSLGEQITKIMEENKVTGFEEYFGGYADANNSQINGTDLIF